jgi:hypothetical protein
VGSFSRQRKSVSGKGQITMTNLEKWLERSCEAVGLQVDFSFTVTCPDGHKIRSVARIRGIGALNGMLIVSDYDEVSDHLDFLSLSGYGFSVLSEPEDNEVFDIESAKEMFRDWGDRPRSLPPEEATRDVPDAPSSSRSD